MTISMTVRFNGLVIIVKIVLSTMIMFVIANIPAFCISSFQSVLSFRIFAKYFFFLRMFVSNIIFNDFTPLYLLFYQVFDGSVNGNYVIIPDTL